MFVVVVINSSRSPDVFGPFNTATEAIYKQEALKREGFDGVISALTN